MNLTLVGTSRCNVPARAAAGGTVAPLTAARTAQRAVPTRADWEKAMGDVGRAGFGIQWLDFAPDAKLRERAEFLSARKYSHPAHNRER